MSEIKMCVLNDRKLCDDCGDCERCDLDPSKKCDNCMRCLGLDGSTDYRAVTISGIFLKETDAD